MAAPERRRNQPRSNSNSSSKVMPKSGSVLAKSVCYTQQQTTVFHGAPMVSGSAAVLLGDVDNDSKGEIEVALGGVDGTLAIFKAAHPTAGPYLVASGLGTLSALGLGTLLLGHSDTRQLIACTGEGVCHIFNIRPADIRWDSESDAGSVQPLWSVACPMNVTCCCIADINGDDRQEVVMGTKDGGVHVLSIEVNPEAEEEQVQGMTSKHPRMGEGTPSGSPRPGEDASSDVYLSSSVTRPRPATPPLHELAIEQAGEWLTHEEDVSDAATPRMGRGPTEYSTDASELRWEVRRSMATDNSQSPPADRTPRAWSGQGPAPEEHDDTLVPLNPHFKSLLELTAAGAVTSLSVLTYPEVSASSLAVTGALSHAAAAAGEGDGAAAGRDVVGGVGGGPDDGGGDSGAAGYPPADEEEGVSRRCSSRCGSDSNSGGKRQGGDCRDSTAAAKIEVEDLDDSAAGVYVAVGLEMGAAEVIRLSTRRSGTRFWDLVDALDRPGRPSAVRDAPGRDDVLDGRAPGDGDSHLSGFDRDPVSPETHPPGGNKASASGPVEELGSFARTTSDGQDGAIRLDPQRGTEIGMEENALPEKEAAAVTAAGEGDASVPCGWRVPLDVCGSGPRLPSVGWDGRGLVVGLSSPRPAAAAASASFASTPNTPLPRTFRGVVRWGWGKPGEGTAGGGAAGFGGEPDGRDEEEQTFAVCTLGGRVRCCRLVSTTGGQPQWRVLWTRQTKETFFAFQRLNYPTSLDSHGLGEDGQSMLVGCSWSGNTVIFDAEGKSCTVFDPEPFLSHPLTAFVAGDLTTAAGSTGPSLIYVSAGGEVVAYHGLPEQTELVAPTQFVRALHADGSMDALRILVDRLVERLQWPSNKSIPLFPPPSRQREGTVPGLDRIDGEDAGADFVANGAAAAASASAPSKDEQDSALSLRDAVLARAVLSPAGVAFALGKSARKYGRLRNGADDDGGGGGGEERWRREVRALARGEGGTITFDEGLAAAERVLREIKVWEARGRDPTLRNFPCLRGTVAALSLWGSGQREEELRNALGELEANAEAGDALFA